MKQGEKIYIYLAVFLIINLLLIVSLIYPTFNNIKQNSRELLSQKNELHSFLKEVETLENIKIFYEENEEDFVKVNEKFVDIEIPVEFIRFLEENARELGLSIEISSLTSSIKINDLWPGFSLQVSINGSFVNSMKFLEKLENGPYLVEINSFTQRFLEEDRNNVHSLFSINVFAK